MDKVIIIQQMPINETVIVKNFRVVIRLHFELWF